MKVGIDIGTSYSSICCLNRDGKAEPIKVDTGLSIFGSEYSLPSAVFLQNNKFIVGQAACNQRAKNPQNFKSEFKRDFGQNVPYTIGGKSVYPEDLYKQLFIYLKKRAEDETGEFISRSFITYPATFSKKQKELLSKTANQAGLLNIQLIEEPVAAANSYLANGHLDNGETVLIYDFGGGTFDAALLRYADGKFDLLTSPLGRERCGGIDIDREVYNEIIKTIPKDTIEHLKSNSPVVYRKLMVHLFELSVQAKHHLSSFDKFEIDIATGLDSVEFSIDINRFNSLISKYIDETIITINDLLLKAGLNKQDINKVVFAGGTCRIPLVRTKINQIFPDKIHCPTNPELSIAMGATLKHSNYEDESNEFYIYCSKCNEKRLTKEVKCSVCGTEINIPEYITENMKKQYLKSLTEFLQQVNRNSIYETENLINGTVANFVETIQYAKGVASHKDLNSLFTNHFHNGMDTFLQRCVSNEFHVAIIGTIKSGKSTLINALLERELASTSVTPETAALTKFRSSKDKDYVKVTFYNKNEWEELWVSVDESGVNATAFKEEYLKLNTEDYHNLYINHTEIIEEFNDTRQLKEFIKKWSSSKSAEHYFVKELEIGLTDFEVPEEVVFVDTPGLDDPVPYRSNITRKYIDRANLVLVCIDSKRLSQPELNIVYRIFTNTRYNPEKVFIIGTQVDSLNSPIEDWLELKNEWLKYLTSDNCYGDKKIADKNLLHVSAGLYSCLLKYKKKEFMSDKENLIFKTGVLKYRFDNVNNEQDYCRLVDYTNLRQIRNILMDLPIKNAKRLMLQDITEKYKKLKVEVFSNYSIIKKDYSEFIDLLNKGIEDISDKISVKRRIAEQTNKEKDVMNRFLKDFKNKSENNLNDLLMKIKRKI